MKKLILTAFLVLSVASLAACGSNDAATDSEVSTEATTIEAVDGDSVVTETTEAASEADADVETTTEAE